MSNVMMQPKQQAQQDAPMHRTPPAGANLTNARGMVAPRHYADGTASVPTAASVMTPEDLATLRGVPTYRTPAIEQSLAGLAQKYPQLNLSLPNAHPQPGVDLVQPPTRPAWQNPSAQGGGPVAPASAPISPFGWPGQPSPPATHIVGRAAGVGLPTVPDYVRPGPPAAPIALYGQDAPTIQPLPAGRGFGASAGIDFNSRNTFAPAPGPQEVAPAPAPNLFAHMVGRGLPFNAAEARDHLNVAATGMPSPAAAAPAAAPSDMETGAASLGNAVTRYYSAPIALDQERLHRSCVRGRARYDIH